MSRPSCDNIRINFPFYLQSIHVHVSKLLTSTNIIRNIWHSAEQFIIKAIALINGVTTGNASILHFDVEVTKCSWKIIDWHISNKGDRKVRHKKIITIDLVSTLLRKNSNFVQTFYAHRSGSVVGRMQLQLRLLSAWQDVTLSIWILLTKIPYDFIAFIVVYNPSLKLDFGHFTSAFLYF